MMEVIIPRMRVRSRQEIRTALMRTGLSGRVLDEAIHDEIQDQLREIDLLNKSTKQPVTDWSEPAVRDDCERDMGKSPIHRDLTGNDFNE